LSKMFDFDDLGVSKNILFWYIMGTIYMRPFCRLKNVSIFNYKYFTPVTSGVDSFAYHWSTHNNWLVPPVYLVRKCINHMRLCKAKGTLVVPKSKSALFWPMLVNRFTNNFKSFVLEIREYEKSMDLLVKSSHDNSVFTHRPFNSNVIVILIDFSRI
jgi:hypothetical protein